MLKLTFVGDIACDRPLLKAAKHGGKYDFSRVFKTGNVFKDSDLVIGNLESCFGGAHYGKKPYHYSVPDSFCDAVREAGFDIVGTANNHSLDEEVKGLVRTLDLLDKNGIAHTGTFRGDKDEKRYLVTEKNGVKIAFYSVTYSVNSNYEAFKCDDVHKYVNMIGYKPTNYSRNPIRRVWQVRLRPELQKIRLKKKAGTIIPAYKDRLREWSINKDWLNEIDEHIAEAKKESDILIILLHIGGQFNTEPGEFSEYMVDHFCKLGADVIVGHHPHTLQRIEKRGDTHIAFSLGGYCLSPSGEYLVRESLPEYSAAWHIEIGDDKKVKDTSVTILKCVEDPDHYAHVIEAEKESESIRKIKERLYGLN